MLIKKKKEKKKRKKKKKKKENPSFKMVLKLIQTYSFWFHCFMAYQPLWAI